MEILERSSVDSKTTKRLNWKYIAGLIDGEGCFDVQITLGKWIRPRVRIGMAKPGKEVLETFKLFFGGFLFEHKSTNPDWQDKYSWELNGYTYVCKFLRNFVNHLRIKKEQARFLLWMETNLKGKQVSDDLRLCVRQELSAMKHDPHRLSEIAQEQVLKFL